MARCGSLVHAFVPLGKVDPSDVDTIPPDDILIRVAGDPLPDVEVVKEGQDFGCRIELVGDGHLRAELVSLEYCTEFQLRG
jgi:hypothetical protein